MGKGSVKRRLFRGGGRSVGSCVGRILLAFVVVAGVFSLSTLNRLQALDGTLDGGSTGGQPSGLRSIHESNAFSDELEGLRSEGRGAGNAAESLGIGGGTLARDRSPARPSELSLGGSFHDRSGDAVELIAGETHEKMESGQDDDDVAGDREAIAINDDDDDDDDDGDDGDGDGQSEVKGVGGAASPGGSEEGGWVDEAGEGQDPVEEVFAEERTGAAASGEKATAAEPQEVLDKATGLSHSFLEELESIGSIEEYLKDTKVDYEKVQNSGAKNHKIEQAFSMAHWKEWQKTEKGVNEYYKLNVLFDDSSYDEKETWKETKIRIPPPRQSTPRSRRRRRDPASPRSRSSATPVVDGEHKMLPATLPCDEKVLRGLSKRERAKTGCFKTTRRRGGTTA
ncbi:hypothetical protein HOP50_01g05330 [Chloropicon primus]|uniref:Uncharacterized protein n=1 Tax=Chloropicon primus TaxID=1764295 RepID=A0A5B8MC53_9CHLO|nr:hypothetical protein A3770_01p05450 [Chloropicon primus]UPQ97242.1 hypothetical protein HOP50_01g05330 [Chloropicon primus]|eukprot:QDZ18027.1 hypothetical protein A3770_01p05450 [Chloropicon primus]